MMRLGFGGRLAVIVVLSLLGVQLLAVIAYFGQRGRDTDTGFRMPLPDQVAAIVELLENAPSGQRQALLRALNGPNLRVRLTDGPAETPPPELWQQSPFVERTLKRYLNALGERKVTVLVETQIGPLQGKRWINYASPAALQVLVLLTTGETLIVDAAGWLTINIFGFPPGFWAGVGGVIIALITIWIVRREALPLRELAKAVDAMNLPRETAPLNDAPRSAPEIRAVIAAFNRLTERIARLMRDRLALVGGISHDLRTYATRLRLRVEKIPDETERAKAVRDIDDMSALLDDALLAIEDRACIRPQELAYLSEILEREADDRRFSGEIVTLSLDWENRAPLVLGDAIALRRMIANIVDNALKYGGAAAISARSAGGYTTIAVDDKGPGIPPELRAHVTQPFVRLEASRSRRTGGAGLGLAIAQNIATAHGGSLSIDDAPGGGARISLTLPLFCS